MDDEEPVRLLAGTMAAILGYEVILAQDGEEAVRFYVTARAAGSPFDAVLLDLQVRDGMGGLDAFRELREIDPGARAILSSGNLGHPALAGYRALGFSGVLEKPYQLKVFSDALAAVVRQKHAPPARRPREGTGRLFEIQRISR